MRERFSMDKMARDVDREAARGGGVSTALPATLDAEAREADEAVIRARIYTVRGVQVMLADDLAPLYGVEVKYL